MNNLGTAPDSARNLVSHLTVFDLLDRLCSHHHDRKTIDNCALVDGRGKRAFVPPDDPRHPRRPARAA